MNQQWYSDLFDEYDQRLIDSALVGIIRGMCDSGLYDDEELGKEMRIAVAAFNNRREELKK